MKKLWKRRKTGIFRHQAGVTYYTRELERRVFFFLTIAMLVIGILYKIGSL